MPDVVVTISERLYLDGPLLTAQRGGYLHPLLVKLYDAVKGLGLIRIAATFTGKPRELVLLQQHEDGRWSLPRGQLQELAGAIKASGNTALWASEVKSNAAPPCSPGDLEEQTEGAVTFRPYQRDLITQIHKSRQGVVVLPCGAGKTLTGMAAAVTSGEPTLVLVHLEDLSDQWVETCQRLTGRLPRLIGGGEHDTRPLRPGEICVALVQTIRQNLRAYGPFLESVGFLLVDEAHRAPSDTFGEVVNACPARYRIGLSATPKRSDGLTPALHAYMGPVIYSLPGGARSLIKMGYLRKPTVMLVKSSFKPDRTCHEWFIDCPDCKESDSPARKLNTQILISGLDKQRALQEGKVKHNVKGCSYVFKGTEPVTYGHLLAAVAQNKAGLDAQRNLLAVDLVKTTTDLGRSVLVLTNRKSAVLDLCARLRRLGVEVLGLTSNESKDERNAALRKARLGLVRCLVATQLADEGLDVPVLDTLVNLSGGRDSGLAQQRLGRICRPAGHEAPLCFDIVDDYQSARQGAQLRVEAYREAYGHDCVPTHKAVDVNTALQVAKLFDLAPDIAVHRLLSLVK